MLLNDIGRVPTTTLRKINQHLESNYGFKITEDAKDQDLVSIMETIQEEISDLKLKGDDARGSPEISKRLLVLEGLKTLREFAMLQFQSPKLESVISGMTQFVVDTFHHSGTNMSDFEEALKDAMKVYRSSKYRFPDEYIEQRVRSAAMAALQESPLQNTSSPVGMMEDENEEIADEDTDGLEESTWDHIGKRDHARGSQAITQLTPGQNDIISKLGINSNNSSPEKDEQVPMVRNPHTGQMQPDPFAAQAAARRKGIAMREDKNLVKHLRALLETEVSQAEVMMAAKGFAQELQEMVEKIGRLQNEDLPPVTDQMRETYGMESASAFQTQIYGALQSVMDALYTAKGQVDDAVGNMAATGQVTATVDMDKDIGMDDGMGDLEGAADLDLDNIGDDLGAEDEFGGAEGEEPLGRSMKTEAALQRKVMEMKNLVAKARKLKEARK